MTLTLPWMERIRERLEEKTDMVNCEDMKFKEFEFIMDFLKPIIEYGEVEEKRIKEKFEECKKDGCDKEN